MAERTNTTMPESSQPQISGNQDESFADELWDDTKCHELAKAADQVPVVANGTVLNAQGHHHPFRTAPFAENALPSTETMIEILDEIAGCKHAQCFSAHLKSIRDCFDEATCPFDEASCPRYTRHPEQFSKDMQDIFNEGKKTEKWGTVLAAHYLSKRLDRLLAKHTEPSPEEEEAHRRIVIHELDGASPQGISSSAPPAPDDHSACVQAIVQGSVQGPSGGKAHSPNPTTTTTTREGTMVGEGTHTSTAPIAEASLPNNEATGNNTKPQVATGEEIATAYPGEPDTMNNLGGCNNFVPEGEFIGNRLLIDCAIEYMKTVQGKLPSDIVLARGFVPFAKKKYNIKFRFWKALEKRFGEDAWKNVKFEEWRSPKDALTSKFRSLRQYLEDWDKPETERTPNWQAKWPLYLVDINQEKPLKLYLDKQSSMNSVAAPSPSPASAPVNSVDHDSRITGQKQCLTDPTGMPDAKRKKKDEDMLSRRKDAPETVVLRADARQMLEDAWSTNHRKVSSSWKFLTDQRNGRSALEFAIDYVIDIANYGLLNDKRKDCLDLLFSEPWKKWQIECGVSWGDSRNEIYVEELRKRVNREGLQKTLKLLLPALYMEVLNCIAYMKSKPEAKRTDEERLFIGWHFWCEDHDLSAAFKDDLAKCQDELAGPGQRAGRHGGTFNKRLWKLLQILEVQNEEDFILFSKPIKRPRTAEEVRQTFSADKGVFDGISEAYVEKLCKHLCIPYSH